MWGKKGRVLRFICGGLNLPACYYSHTHVVIMAAGLAPAIQQLHAATSQTKPFIKDTCSCTTVVLYCILNVRRWKYVVILCKVRTVSAFFSCCVSFGALIGPQEALGGEGGCRSDSQHHTGSGCNVGYGGLLLDTACWDGLPGFINGMLDFLYTCTLLSSFTCTSP